MHDKSKNRRTSDAILGTLIGVICIFFSVIVTVAVTLLTKAPEKELLHNAFDAPLEDEIK